MLASRRPGVTVSRAGETLVGCGPAFHKWTIFGALRGLQLGVAVKGFQGWTLLGLFGLSWLSFFEKPMIPDVFYVVTATETLWQ